MTIKCHHLIFLLSSLLMIGVDPVCNGAPRRSTNTNRYDAIVEYYGRVNKIHPLLIKAVIWRESKFNRLSVGKAGEIGLMQITHDAAIDWARKNNAAVPTRAEMFNPSTNIRIGSWYLAQARDHWISSRYAHVLALCEYNAGRKGMKRKVLVRGNGKIGISDQALRTYVNTIVEKYNHYVYVDNLSQSETVQVSRTGRK